MHKGIFHVPPSFIISWVLSLAGGECISFGPVIPAKAGIHGMYGQAAFLDTGFRRCDG